VIVKAVENPRIIEIIQASLWLRKQGEKLIATRILFGASKAFRILACAVVLSCLCSSPSASAQFQIQCGQAISGSIAVPGEADRYTFGATAGDVITPILLISTTANFNPQYQLYDPDGLLISVSFSTTKIALTKTGTYTILVSYGFGSSQTGGYALAFQRTKNPCNATAIVCATPQSGSIDAVAELDAFTFSGTAGDVITPILLTSTTANFHPQYQLYDPDGLLIPIGLSTKTITLPKTGTYTIMVSYGFGSSQTGGYALAFQRSKNPCNATAIVCATPQSGSIDAVAELDSFTFSATAGDVIPLINLTSTTANFNPQYQLYDPDGLLVFIGLGTTTITLPKTGTYTILVSYGFGSSQTGGYALAFQRSKNPCNAMQLMECQSIKASISAAAELDAYVFNGTAGQTAVLGATGTTPSFSPKIELFDPDGILINSSSSIMTQLLSKTGAHTVLVSPETGSAVIGGYTLSLGNISVILSSPNGGEVFFAGSTVPIVWASVASNPALASHDIRISTDGGASYPMVIASGLPATAQSFNWNVPTHFIASNARIRIIARDSAGNTCNDDGDANFVVVRLTPTSSVTYLYDELNRLIKATYLDGTTIIYTYDATGNRLSEVVSGACTFAISPISKTFGSSGGTGSVSVTAPGNCNWTATSNANWITITSGTTGTGNGTVNYSVAANTGLSRIGTIAIAGQTFIVTQDSGCTFSINPTSQDLTALGGAGSVSVSTPNGCSWTAVSNASWITITSDNSGVGIGTVNYSVASNTSNKLRNGTINIAGKTFTVKQKGR